MPGRSRSRVPAGHRRARGSSSGLPFLRSQGRCQTVAVMCCACVMLVPGARVGVRRNHPPGVAPACTLPQCAHCHAAAAPLDSHAVRLAIPRETAPREQRVSLIPETVAKLVKAGFQAVVEAGAGLAAGHVDEAYQKAGATIASGFAACVDGTNAVFKVREPSPEEIAAIPEGALLLGLLGRGENAEQMARYRARRLGVFSLSALPRISRAQKMDALSSMAA